MTGRDGQARRRAGWTVRAQILVAILAVAAIGMAIAGVVAYLVQRETVLAGIDAELAAQPGAAQRVLDSLEPPPASAEDALADVLAVVAPLAHGSALGVVDGRAALLPGVEIGYRLDDIPGFVERVVAEVEDGSVRLGSVVDARLGEVRYVAVPVGVPEREDQGIFVSAVAVAPTMAPIDRAFVIYAIAAAVVLGAIGAIGWLVAGRLLRPIRTLSRTARRITAYDLDERMLVTGTDDVSALTWTINDMLDRLQHALRSQRDLLADVRHELRTPLTVVRGHLEVMDPRDAESAADAREIAIQEVDRMAGLVDGLVTLAEMRISDPVRLPVDIADLTRATAARAAVIPRHEWRVTEVAEAVVPLDRDRIVQAWLQLADNAAKYSPQGSPIDIGSTVTDGLLELWVRDRGPGVSPELASRIFGRRTRGPASDAIGSGLGLAIVSDIAHAHGGEVRVESGETTRFVLALPTGDRPLEIREETRTR